MKRRRFIQALGSLVAGAFVSNIAAIYSPGRPWSVAVPKPLPVLFNHDPNQVFARVARIFCA